jgi:hypothetical protein
MPNKPVRAAAEGMPTEEITRRTILTGLGAAAAASVTLRKAESAGLDSAGGSSVEKEAHMNMINHQFQPVQSAELVQLVDAHRAAHAEFLAAIDLEEEKDSAYNNAFPNPDELIVPLSIGGAVSLRVDYNWQDDHIADCRKRIAEAYQKKANALAAVVGSLGITSAEDVTCRLRKGQADDLRRMRRALQEELARREAFGLLPANRARDDAGAGETYAAAALLAYRCRTQEETRLRAEYIAAGQGSGNLIYDGLRSGEDCLLHALLFASLPEE